MPLCYILLPILFDFAVAIEDSIDGVTHAFRSKEFELREELIEYEKYAEFDSSIFNFSKKNQWIISKICWRRTTI